MYKCFLYGYNFLITVQKSGDFICSQLAAHSMKAAERWEYRNKGILSRPEAAVTPQNLFADEVVFKPWKKEDQFFLCEKN